MNDLISRQAAIDCVTVGAKPTTIRGRIAELPSAEPESCEYWDAESNYCALNRPSAQPEPEEFEWCTGCKEYDQEAHCCHRWTKAIRNTVEEIKNAQPEPRWIPVTERLPNDNSVVVVCGEKGTWDFGTYRGHMPSHINFWNWKKNTVKEVHWWMYKKDALPEPWKGGAK